MQTDNDPLDGTGSLLERSGKFQYQLEAAGWRIDGGRASPVADPWPPLKRWCRWCCIIVEHWHGRSASHMPTGHQSAAECTFLKHTTYTSAANHTCGPQAQVPTLARYRPRSRPTFPISRPTLAAVLQPSTLDPGPPPAVGQFKSARRTRRGRVTGGCASLARRALPDSLPRVRRQRVVQGIWVTQLANSRSDGRVDCF